MGEGGGQAGNKYNINSLIGPYSKYFARNKRIALTIALAILCCGQNISQYGPIKELILYKH